MVGISSVAAYIPPCPIESLRDSARLGLIHTLGGVACISIAGNEPG